MAYQAFVVRKFRLDESPDAYMADVQRLLNLLDHEAMDEDTDPVLIEQFLVGLPSTFAKDMRMSWAREQLKVSACLTKLHALHSASADSKMMAPVERPTPLAAVTPRGETVITKPGQQLCVTNAKRLATFADTVRVQRNEGPVFLR